jgi:hypothetical protein
VCRRAGRVVYGEDREAAPEKRVRRIGNLYLLGENWLICVIEWGIDLMGRTTRGVSTPHSGTSVPRTTRKLEWEVVPWPKGRQSVKAVLPQF